MQRCSHVGGGLGGAIAECVASEHPVPVRSLGTTECTPTGSASWLLGYFNLVADGIVAATQKLLADGRTYE